MKGGDLSGEKKLTEKDTPELDQSEIRSTRRRQNTSSGLIALFAFAIAVTPEFDFLGIPKVRVTDLLLPLILLTVGSNVIRKNGPNGKPRKFPFTALFANIICWDLCSLFLFGSADIRPGIFYLAKRVAFFLIAYMGYAAVDSMESFTKIIRGLLWACPILCLSVLLEARYKSDDGLSGDAMRASGIIEGQQASTAMFIVIVLCLCGGLWAATENKTPLLVTVLLGIAAIFATGTKGALLSGGFAMLILALAPGRARIPLHYLILPIVLGWIILPDRLRDRLMGVAPEISQVYAGLTEDSSLMPSAGSSSLASRIVTAQAVMTDLIPQSPLLGLGTGFKHLGSIDNFYLTEWVYHGLVGLILFLILIRKMLMLFLESIRNIRAPTGRAAATGMLAALGAMLISGLHAESFYLIRPMECFMLLTGLVAGCQSVQEAVQKGRPGPRFNKFPIPGRP